MVFNTSGDKMFIATVPQEVFRLHFLWILSSSSYHHIFCRQSKPHLIIFDFVQFGSLHTRSSSNLKLKHPLSNNKFERSSYFNRIPRLWNSLPSVNIHLPLSTIKSKLRKYFWDHFIANFSSDNLCTYHLLCLCHKCCKNPVNMHFSYTL